MNNNDFFDLENRTLMFAKRVRAFSKKVKHTLENIEDLKQLIRSSGSVGANYIEANESLSENDCTYRMRVCKKEAKESKYWLHLIDITYNPELASERDDLIQESIEIMNIFGSMIRKRELKSR